MKGHWVGIFGGNEKRATIDFTERIEPKKWFMIPFVKIYLKYRQAKYVRDLRNVLKRVRPQSFGNHYDEIRIDNGISPNCIHDSRIRGDYYVQVLARL